MSKNRHKNIVTGIICYNKLSPRSFILERLNSTFQDVCDNEIKEGRVKAWKKK